MRKDGLEFFDGNERVVFNYNSFCEVLKGCVREYCHVSKEEANNTIESAELFKSPVSQLNDVYFFSHEHPFHWAMLCCHGDQYWEENPHLLVVPETYDDWERNYIIENGLKSDLFVFTIV